MTAPLLDELLTRVREGETLPTADLFTYGREPDALALLVEALRDDAWEDVRATGAAMVADLGRVKIPPEGIVPERPGPIVVDVEAVSYLVECLNDPSREVRRRACIPLAGLVPHDLIEARSEEVLDALELHPTTDAATVLMGKTGSQEALRRLREEPVYSAASATDARMARARLGCAESEESVLSDFEGAVTADAVAEHARRLGYVASERTKRRLAMEIRTPLMYMWHPPAERSVRIHIIEGLHLAFLREPIFWHPFMQPSDDDYYEAIEAWLTEHLGVTWDTPRPPFLYQHSAPMPLPGGES